MALPLGAARYSHSVRMRVGLAGFLVCATLASCTRAAPEPHPDHTLEPSITESSPMPTANPDNPACTLLTKKDRSDLVGYSMDAEAPVRPARGTAECIWVHSLHESVRAAIRVVAFSGQVWARYLRPQIRAAMLQPNTGKQLTEKLEKLWKELGKSGGRLPADEICPTYLLLAEARGAIRNGDTLFYATIGSMTAAYAMACEDGNMLLVGYGEYGIGPSIALQNGVLRLLAAAEENAGDIFEVVGSELPPSDDSDETGSASPTPESGEDTTDEDASPSPEPSPSETAESNSDDSDTS